MNYLKIYNNLMIKAQNRKLDKNVYKEKHHIIPKCVGGNDKKNNIVELLAREHFVAHLLLIKIYSNNYRLWFALNMMQVNNKYQIRNNKIYESIKIKFSKINSKIQKDRLKNKKNHPMYGKKHSEESIIKNMKSQKGRTFEELYGKERAKEMKKDISNRLKGRKWSIESRLKLSKSIKGRKMKSPSKETREKISKFHKGKKKTEEHKKKISESNKGVNTWTKGTRYINKNNIVKRIKEEKIQYYLNLGWKEGMK